ncbi:MAG: hypothetical protein NTV57_17240 [Cyanobacteria bacterium]|nr:hypothetical protein [Cyanobacteriota bacterium]
MTKSTLSRLSQSSPNHLEARDDRQGSAQPGFTILEVMMAAIIAIVAATILYPLFNESLIIGRQSADRNSIEAATSLDLSWIKRYAKFWKMKSGPYPLDNSHTKSSDTFQISPVLEYECANSDLTTTNLSQQFINDAVSIANTTNDVTPKLPYSFSATANSPIPITNLSPGYTLSRTVDASNANRIYVVYKVTSTNDRPINFVREASVALESVAWCTPT